MILTSRTPLRISLFGGGTDYPEYFHRMPGAVIGFAIDKYIYISALSLGAFVDYRYRISYSRVETVEDVGQIENPVVRAVLGEEKHSDPTDSSIQADLPASAGLGSSSAFTVGFQHLVWALKGADVSPVALAERAIHIEQSLLGERVGVQDQMQAAHGGFNRFDFSGDTNRISPMGLSADDLSALSRWMVLVYTGRKRHASEVLDEQMENTVGGSVDEELAAMKQLVDAAEQVIRNAAAACDIAPGLAPLLAESWDLKRRLSARISDAEIDALYDAGIEAGALAGKLCGAGGGGFLLMIVPPDRREGFLKAMGRRRCVDFGIDSRGSTILRTDFPD
jgi:D-glycero-alpha-D-manno-heptose-7-phosphate kinase